MIVDTREQQPWDLAPMRSERGTLPTGDYTIKGLERLVAIERKSLPDLLGCIGRDRERFEAEMQRMLAYRWPYLVIEASLEDIENGRWKRKVHPHAVYGSLVGWEARGVHVKLMGDVGGCQRFVQSLAFTIARRYVEQLREIEKSLAISS